MVVLSSEENDADVQFKRYVAPSSRVFSFRISQTDAFLLYTVTCSRVRSW